MRSLACTYEALRKKLAVKQNTVVLGFSSAIDFNRQHLHRILQRLFKLYESYCPYSAKRCLKTVRKTFASRGSFTFIFLETY